MVEEHMWITHPKNDSNIVNKDVTPTIMLKIHSYLRYSNQDLDISKSSENLLGHLRRLL